MYRILKFVLGPRILGLTESVFATGAFGTIGKWSWNLATGGESKRVVYGPILAALAVYGAVRRSVACASLCSTPPSRSLKSAPSAERLKCQSCSAWRIVHDVAARPHVFVPDTTIIGIDGVSTSPNIR